MSAFPQLVFLSHYTSC